MIKTKISPTKALLALGLISTFCAGLVTLPTFADDAAPQSGLSLTPNAKFEQCVVDSYNYENNTTLTTLTAEQKASLKELSCNLDGAWVGGEDGSMADFASLEGLYLWNRINNSTLDLSSNTNLKIVKIHNAPDLASITFPSSPNIEELSLAETNITNLNLSNFSKLESLATTDASTVNLPESDVLTSILVKGVSSLDVSKNPNLTYLFVVEGDISSLDLSQNTELKTLSIGDTKISEIDLSHSLKLTSFELFNNAFSKLDISKNEKLTWLRIVGSELSEIDTSIYPDLASLYLSDNNLKELDVSKNPKLGSLDVSNNRIKSINFGDKNTELHYLIATNSELTYVDLSQADEENLWANLSDNKSLEIVAVPKSWEGKYTEEEIRNRLGLDENQKDVIIQYGPIKVPDTGLAISEMAKYGAIVVLPAILMFAAIAKNATKVRSKRVRFSR